MKRFILYVHIGNMPKAKAKQYLNDMAVSVRSSGIVAEYEPLLVLPRVHGDTELCVVPE